MIIRITSELSEEYVEGKIADDSSFDDVAELFDGLCIAHGFHPDTVKDWRSNES